MLRLLNSYRLSFSLVWAFFTVIDKEANSLTVQKLKGLGQSG
jgi:hypothetical protein